MHAGDGATAAYRTRARVVAADEENDLALLKVQSTFAAIGRFRSGRGIRSGEAVVVVGYPLQSLLASDAKVTVGSVSAMAGIGDDTRMIQVSAPTQPGNSGGPVFDAAGNVVGVLSSTLNALQLAKVRGILPQNINFAIKSAIAQNFFEAKGVGYETAESTAELRPVEVADRAKNFTYLIECWN